MNIQELASVAGVVLSLALLAISIWNHTYLKRRQFAVNMIREWNEKTANDKRCVERAFPGIFDSCARLSVKSAQLVLEADSDPNLVIGKAKIPGHEVKGALIKLLNYFEFIASSSSNNAAAKKIVRQSFEGTMIHYYCILENFIYEQMKAIGRNPWKPYTDYVKNVAKYRANTDNDKIPKCMILHKGEHATIECHKSPCGLVLKTFRI